MALLDITTRQGVRDWKGLEADGGASDAWIDSAIQALSKRLENALARALLSEAQVETFDVDDGQTIFMLRGYPVDEEGTFSVRLDTLRVFDAPRELQVEFFTLDAEQGTLIIDGVGLPPGPRILRVAYTGGMAATTEAFCTAYPDIEEAANIQVNFWWESRQRIGQRSVTGQDLSVVTLEPLEFLPQMQRVVENYRRRRW